MAKKEFTPVHTHIIKNCARWVVRPFIFDQREQREVADRLVACTIPFCFEALIRPDMPETDEQEEAFATLAYLLVEVLQHGIEYATLAMKGIM